VQSRISKRRGNDESSLRNLKLPLQWAPDDGDQREFDLETRVTTNGNRIISEMLHSCALNK